MYNGYKRYNKGVEPPNVPPVHEIRKGTLGKLMGYEGGTQGVHSRTCTCTPCILGIDTHGYTRDAVGVRSKLYRY